MKRIKNFTLVIIGPFFLTLTLSSCCHREAQTIKTKTASALIAGMAQTSLEMQLNNGPVTATGRKLDLWDETLKGFLTLPEKEMVLFLVYFLSQKFLDGERATTARFFVDVYQRSFPDADLVSSIESLDPRARDIMIKESGGSAQLLAQRIKWLGKAHSKNHKQAS